MNTSSGGGQELLGNPGTPYPATRIVPSMLRIQGNMNQEKPVIRPPDRTHVRHTTDPKLDSHSTHSSQGTSGSTQQPPRHCPHTSERLHKDPGKTPVTPLPFAPYYPIRCYPIATQQLRQHQCQHEQDTPKGPQVPTGHRCLCHATTLLPPPAAHVVELHCMAGSMAVKLIPADACTCEADGCRTGQHTYTRCSHAHRLRSNRPSQDQRPPECTSYRHRQSIHSPSATSPTTAR